MRMPMKAGFTIPRVFYLASALLVAACAGESTSPAASTSTKAIEATSTFRPTEASRALVGVTDGTYNVAFNPREGLTIGTAGNQLVIPANAVCDMQKSGYGPEYWDKPCTLEKGKINLTIVVKNASSVHPSINFYPAMRFSPDKNVMLSIYVKQLDEQARKDWWMFYCTDAGKCVDESATDASLQTYIDYNASVLFRRVKHFSGYVVAERVEEAEATALQ
jgi:hypothetical protein